jgi:hypothetical protein
MEVFDLSDAPPFTALSYTWGPVSPTFTILVNEKFSKFEKACFDFSRLMTVLNTSGSIRSVSTNQMCLSEITKLG